MLGFLLRLLPFWVREPLLIVLGSVLGVRLMYLGVHDRDWAAAGLGVVFVVFTAIRVVGVIRALRARRNRGPAAAHVDAAGVAGGDGAAGTQVQVQVQAAAGPHPDPAAPENATAERAVPQGDVPEKAAPERAMPEKEPNAWLQAVAAVAVFAAIGAALWLVPDKLTSADSTPKAASCPSGEHEKLPKVYRQNSRAVTGDELCKALNRPDLAQLLGTPGEIADTASSTSGTAPLTAEKVALPEAKVTFATYSVNLSATYNEMTTAQYVKLMKFGDEQDVRTLTVLGRPAVLSSDHTMKIEISLGGGATGGTGGPVEQGPLARTLTVALDRKDRGGYYDITVWSESGTLPDDSRLSAIAEKIIPTIPERPAR
ncbi:hypothetical protein GCM10014715_55630 [Streptomyces spiralis]|uniref:Uncharacterized protein n=1 Tax=Streptomyces spiralis TaxID=66376 RepID=A0A919A8V2_9ACTN|nr:DUF6215 domain-containing protein [Streptomyces spiralis]GHE92096.1 hypothetical protein GCM10014715_55630 [Streptomyces spiralis]